MELESQRGKKMRERFSGQKKGGTKSDTKVSNNGCEGKKKRDEELKRNMEDFYMDLTREKIYININEWEI